MIMDKKYAKENNDITCILIYCDMFSHQCYFHFLKNKTGESVLIGLKKIYRTIGAKRFVRFLLSDEGKLAQNDPFYVILSIYLSILVRNFTTMLYSRGYLRRKYGSSVSEQPSRPGQPKPLLEFYEKCCQDTKLI
jgi:hypothetical protein